MSENPILTTLKILVGAALAAGLFIYFFQYQSLEVKVVKTHDEVDGMSTNVAELARKVDENTKATQELTHQVKDLASHGVTVRGSGENGTSSDVQKPKGKPQKIGDQTVYPINPGWTVLCDANCNRDPKRDLPKDKIDWNATLHLSVPGEPKGLNYYGTDNTTVVSTISAYVYDSLAELKTSDYKYYNAMLAERIEQSPDKMRYRIYLRKGVRWHDPSPDMLRDHPWLKKPHFVTAKDVKFTLDVIRNPNSGSPAKFNYDKLKSVEILGEYSLEIDWKEPDYYSKDAILGLQPMPEHILAYDPDGNRYSDADVFAQFNQHWFFSQSMCGNGPYRFVEYAKGSYIKLERNESYYGQRAPCKEIYYHIIPDNTQRLAQFWDKKLALTSLVSADYRRIILENKVNRRVSKWDDFNNPAPKSWQWTYFLWRRSTYGGFGWNSRRPLFADARVRRALTMALNRQAVVDKIMYGLGEVVPIGASVLSPYYDQSLKPLPFDKDAAKKLLAEAGWKDTDGDGILDKVIDGKKTDFAFDLLISSSSPEQKQICQMYKADLLDIGIKMTPNPAESALWSRKLANLDFDGFIIFWTASVESDPRQIWWSKYANDPHSNNYTGFANKDADHIFDELHHTWDQKKRIALFHQWYQLEAKEQPYTWIWSVKSPIIVNADWRIPEPRLPFPQIDARLIFKWKSRP